METYATVLSYAIPGFVILIILESLIAKWKGVQVNRPMDTISSLSSGMTNTLKSLTGLFVAIVSYEWMVSQFAIFNIQSTVGLYVLAFIGLDFAGYWSHRFNHRINIMWNRHIIHHSSEEFNLACALRQSISGFIGVYFFLMVPLAIIGVPTQVIAIAGPLHLFAQFWYHTTLIGRLGFLENIIVTPSHHRVHHAINPEYIDKNFSEIFILWDKWFGTFQAEMEDVPCVYGTKKPAGTWNPVLINFMHVWILAKDAWRTENWWDKIRLWFMPTGWRPDDVAEKYPIAIVEKVYARDKYDTPASPFLQAWSWFQLIFHNLLLFYVLTQFANLEFHAVMLYVAFLFISIFAYTTLMDGHWLAIPVEAIKMIFGFFLVWKFEGWFMMENVFSGATYMIAVYLLISFLLTLYFYKTEEKVVYEFS